jgi:hypothetical protein
LESEQGRGRLLARCIVCRGDIHVDDVHEIWEGGYYCVRHSLPHLRERAREYARVLALTKADGSPPTR